jgi:hypothetical protein
MTLEEKGGQAGGGPAIARVLGSGPVGRLVLEGVPGWVAGLAISVPALPNAWPLSGVVAAKQTIFLVGSFGSFGGRKCEGALDILNHGHWLDSTHMCRRAPASPSAEGDQAGKRVAAIGPVYQLLGEILDT